MGAGKSKVGWPSVRLDGKVAIVTGANSGLGFETAKHIAFMGATVILACRDENRAKAAVLRMQADYLELISELREGQGEEGPVPDAPDLKLEYIHLDLASLRSVVEFTKEFKSKDLPLHLLICNAAVAYVPQSMTENGFETHFQVNYLSHFLLTSLLIPVMRQSGSDDSRIINVSSSEHEKGKLDLTNISGKKGYDPTQFYANSKLFQVMSMLTLARRLPDANIGVYAVNPGSVETKLSRHVEDSFINRNMLRIKKTTGQMTDLAHAVATTLNVAVNPHMKELRGYYFSECVPVSPAPKAKSEKRQDVLLQFSLECLGEYLEESAVEALLNPPPAEYPEEPEDDEEGKEEVASL